MAEGKKLFWNLLDQHEMLQSLFPEGNRQSRPWWGCEGSLMMLRARYRERWDEMTLMEGEECRGEKVFNYSS